MVGCIRRRTHRHQHRVQHVAQGSRTGDTVIGNVEAPDCLAPPRRAGFQAEAASTRRQGVEGPASDAHTAPIQHEPDGADQPGGRGVSETSTGSSMLSASRFRR
jgi:hypothetical protein